MNARLPNIIVSANFPAWFGDLDPEIVMGSCPSASSRWVIQRHKAKGQLDVDEG